MSKLKKISASAFMLLVLVLAAPSISYGAVDSGAAGDDAHAEHDTKPPLIPEPDLVVWSLVTFGVFLFLLKKLAWGPMIEGLDSRESAQRQAAAETQHALEKAQGLLADHEAKLAATQDEVREIIAEARSDAEQTGQSIVATAQAEAEASRDRSVAEVGRAKDAALSEIFEAVSGQVVGATEHVLGRALNESDQDRLIGDALQQVANS